MTHDRVFERALVLCAASLATHCAFDSSRLGRARPVISLPGVAAPAQASVSEPASAPLGDTEQAPAIGRVSPEPTSDEAVSTFACAP